MLSPSAITENTDVLLFWYLKMKDLKDNAICAETCCFCGIYFTFTHQIILRHHHCEDRFCFWFASYFWEKFDFTSEYNSAEIDKKIMICCKQNKTGGSFNAMQFEHTQECCGVAVCHVREK